MLSYKALVAENETEEKAAGATLPLNVNAYRMSVAHALLKTGMPFTMLDSGCEIRLLLEDYHAICPKQACSNMIPLLRKKEHVETISELNEAAALETLRGILHRPAGNHLPSGEDALRLELAIIKDAGEPIAHFCNHFEGDGFLAPYAFDSWNNLNRHMRNVVHRYMEVDCVSACTAVAAQIAPNNLPRQQELIQQTVAKAVVVLEKIESDSLTRFKDTLQVLRGCRLVGYQFVKDTTYEALEEEIVFIQHLPVAVPLFDDLHAELRTYKKLADGFDREEDDGWAFWRRYYISLPLWYKVAAEVALVMCSSASVERVFSLLNCLFDDHQHQCLNDYKEASVMIRYNENFRSRKQY